MKPSTSSIEEALQKPSCLWQSWITNLHSEKHSEKWHHFTEWAEQILQVLMLICNVGYIIVLLTCARRRIKIFMPHELYMIPPLMEVQISPLMEVQIFIRGWAHMQFTVHEYLICLQTSLAMHHLVKIQLLKI